MSVRIIPAAPETVHGVFQKVTLLADPIPTPASPFPGGGLPDLSVWMISMIGFGLAFLAMLAMVIMRPKGGGSPSGRATPK
ncbi:MAG: hypothetical protein H0T78_00640, partial [Longispora sp.]|nr:hypothetical protein [Longispora sp. (in: high G+C Gram-positive bacteria)]